MAMIAREVPLTPAELQAIEEHKYYLSQRRRSEVSIEEAIEDFLMVYEQDWRQEKMRRDCQEQIREINKHKFLRSRDAGRDIGRREAAEEWCTKYAHIWRQERESLEQNGFLQISVPVENPDGIHLRPTSELALLVSRFDCDVYVHKDNMEHYNFTLGDKRYMNVKSVLNVLSLGIKPGESIEFLATGREARQALDAIATMVREGGKGARA